MAQACRTQILRRLRKAVDTVRSCITALEEADRARDGIVSERISGYVFGLASGYTEGILHFADRKERDE